MKNSILKVLVRGFKSILILYCFDFTIDYFAHNNLNTKEGHHRSKWVKRLYGIWYITPLKGLPKRQRQRYAAAPPKPEGFDANFRWHITPQHLRHQTNCGALHEQQKTVPHITSHTWGPLMFQATLLSLLLFRFSAKSTTHFSGPFNFLSHVRGSIRFFPCSWIEQSSGCKPKSFPLLYLGAPRIKGRSKAVNFEELIKRIRSKLEGWKTRFLSFAGKITWIKSVLAGIPIYIY